MKATSIPSVAVHAGSFHADEVTAVATLQLAFCAQAVRVLPDSMVHEASASLDVLRVFRTRDPQVIAAADIAADVGMRYDLAYRRFDHHQRGGAGARSGGMGTPYAASGLIWEHFGLTAVRAVLPDLTQDQAQAIHARIDHEFIQPVDACDNGISLGGPSGIQLPALVGMLNPSWMQGDSDPEVLGRAFEQAVGMVRGMIVAAVHNAAARELAYDVVLQSLESEEGGIIVLPRAIPWEETVCKHSPSAKFVVAPSTAGNGFNAYAVPTKANSFQRRTLFPKSWAGLEFNDLVNVTGVDDAVFCHVGRFISVARSLEGAKRLAVLAF
jgi:uncharacterized UPF0160 family protein